MTARTFQLACLLFLLISPIAVRGKDIDYLTQVKPLLAARCYSCHGALKKEAGLRLETRDLMIRGGENGAVIKPGKSKLSLVIKRLTAADDERMPPADEGARLSKAEITILRKWIDEGAKAPPEKTPANPRDHWSFQKPRRPPLPQPRSVDWSKNPIDRFLAVGHQRLGLKPQGLASPSVRLRRLYIDLIGIPPTRQQVQKFVSDSSPQAYAEAVNRLISDKAFGERWGRHWMDVWRYTDWYGLGAQVRYSQKHIWRWRDWIVESVNEDKPYSRMVLEMVAGDEIAPADPKIIRATGFLARNYFLFNRTTWLNGTVEHTSKSLLGLTLNCARCHDHKYDPLQQRDFYRMRAIFEPHQVRLDPVPGETDLNRDGLPRAFDNNPKTPTFLFVRGNEKDPDKSKPIPPGPPILFDPKFVAKAVKLPAASYAPRLQAFVLADHLALANKAVTAARSQVAAAKSVLSRVSKSKTRVKKSSRPGKVFLKDDFSKDRQDQWEVGPGKWQRKNGRLIQSQLGTGLQRLFYRTRKNHPVNFSATVQLTLPGEGRLRSAGIGFDAVGGRDKWVYLSGGGGKVQIAFGISPAYKYPADAKFDQPFKSKVAYKMTVRVRGQLMNVAINGVHRIAYQLPVKREAGRLDLAIYDSTVEFDSIEVRELPDSFAMVPAKNVSVNKGVAKLALATAERRLIAATLKAAAIKAAYAADRAKAKLEGAKQIDALIKQAATVARKYELALVNATVAQKRQEMAVAVGAKKRAAKAALVAAQAQQKKAQAAVAKPGKKYFTIRTTLRAPNGMTDEAKPRQGPYSPVSTGRRTALAKWIIGKGNPLTARVAINHIWQRHFGQPLVASMTDFGLRTKRPVQHQLLDWLAVELMENGWRMKHIHRLIVTSRAFQLESSRLDADTASTRKDAKNEYYWRRKAIRMESQVVRDSILHLAGVLDRKMGGPTVDPSREDSVYRRSMYFTHSRDKKSKFISMFDDADILRCYRRKVSIVPQQALALSNSKLALKMSRLITAGIQKTHAQKSDREFVEVAFETLLLSSPTSDELSACLDAIQETVQLLKKRRQKQPAVRARENLVHALLNHNDFITVR